MTVKKNNIDESKVVLLLETNTITLFKNHLDSYTAEICTEGIHGSIVEVSIYGFTPFAALTALAEKVLGKEATQ